MQFLKLTKNIGGKTIRVNPNYIVDIEEVDMKDDPESKPEVVAKAGAGAKAVEKTKEPRKATVVRRAKGKDLFVTETPEEIDNQVVKIKAIRIEI